MKIKKILNISILTIASLVPIILTTSCSTMNNSLNENNQNQGQENNKINLNKITSINKDSFKELWYKHPSLFQNNILNLSFLPNLTTIENNTFSLDLESPISSNSRISNIIFNKKLKTIGNNAFKNIQSLKNLELPETINKIGDHSFDNAFIDGYSKVQFTNKHSSLDEIGTNAFLNNENLNLFVINNQKLQKKLEEIKENIGYKNTILDDDLESSGEISGLHVSKFLPIISALELTKNTRLSSITNEILNNKIKNNVEIQSKPLYKNIKFEIQNGSSEETGILNLKINIPNIKFTNNNIVEIKGFNKISDSKNLVLESIKINSNQYFSDYQKKENLLTWTNEEWKKYLNQIKVRTNDYLENFDLADHNQSSSIKIEFNYSNTNNKHNIYLISSIEINEYKNGMWVKNNEIKKIIKGYNSKPIEFTLPNNKEDLYSFLNSKIKISENKKMEISEIYSSKYLHNFQKGINTLPNTLLEIDDTYKKYAKELGINKLNIKATSMYANDIDGHLSFDYQMEDEQAISNKFSYINSYQISGFKKLSNIFNENPTIEINREDQNSKKRFINEIKKIINNDQLIDLFNNNKTIEISNLGFYGNSIESLQNTKSIILNNVGRGENSNEKQFLTASNKYNLNNIFPMEKQLTANNIDFKTNLFNDEFIIKDLIFTTNIANSAKLIHQNSSTIKYISDIQLNASINKSSINYESNHNYITNGKLILTLHKNDFNL